MGLNGCLERFSAKHSFSALFFSPRRSGSGPGPAAEVIQARINRDGECGAQEVRSCTAEWEGQRSLPSLHKGGVERKKPELFLLLEKAVTLNVIKNMPKWMDRLRMDGLMGGGMSR